MPRNGARTHARLPACLCAAKPQLSFSLAKAAKSPPREAYVRIEGYSSLVRHGICEQPDGSMEILHISPCFSSLLSTEHSAVAVSVTVSLSDSDSSEEEGPLIVLSTFDPARLVGLYFKRASIATSSYDPLLCMVHVPAFSTLDYSKSTYAPLTLLLRLIWPWRVPSLLSPYPLHLPSFRHTPPLLTTAACSHKATSTAHCGSPVQRSISSGSLPLCQPRLFQPTPILVHSYNHHRSTPTLLWRGQPLTRSLHHCLLLVKSQSVVSPV